MTWQGWTRSAGCSVAMALALGKIVGASPKPPWVIEIRYVTTVDLPSAIRAAANWGGFEPPFTGVLADLNGDGVDDYILKGNESVCGTGGCPFILIDGSRATLIGHLFGDPLVVRAESTHRFLDIDGYSHGGAESGTLSSYAFDGEKYVERSIRHLQGRALGQLAATWKKLPR